MDKFSIIAEYAARRQVEGIVKNCFRVDQLSASLEDLCQMVYEVMLRMPEEKITGAYSRGELKNIAARIVVNQRNEPRSQWHKLVTEFSRRSVDGWEEDRQGDDDSPDS